MERQKLKPGRKKGAKFTAEQLAKLQGPKSEIHKANMKAAQIRRREREGNSRTL